jgi:hypothetical protein
VIRMTLSARQHDAISRIYPFKRFHRRMTVIAEVGSETGEEAKVRCRFCSNLSDLVGAANSIL